LTRARIALLRHGHTAWNRAGRIQGQVDVPLDEEARDRLARLRLPDAYKQWTLVASPLCRAIETAQLVAKRSPEIVPELIELDWGVWQGLHGGDLADAKSGYRHLEEWGWDFQPPGGESPKMAWQRIAPWIAAARGTIVAVTHIGVIRVLLARATGWNFCGPAPILVKRNRLFVVNVTADGTLAIDGEPVRLKNESEQ
jgi:broad specificity phosphatase PhoE